MTVPNRRASSPWTVVLQGTPVAYDDSSLLDKLEYALMVGGPAAERHLSQPNSLKDIAHALAGATQNLTKPEGLIRAGKLLSAITEYIVKSKKNTLTEFTSGLPDLFSSFLSPISTDKEVSSWYLSSLGVLFGQRALETSPDAAKLTEQKTTYIHHVTTLLNAIIDECMSSSSAPNDDHEEDVMVDNSVIQAATSTLGYIPTVPGIGDMQPLNTGDEQLGRVLIGLSAFLSVDSNRVLFTHFNSATASLAALLDKDVGLPIQVYYQSIFCIWLLSFSSASAVTIELASLPRRLTNVLREIGSEKVIRITLATLRNLLSLSSALRKEMVGAGLVNALQSPAFKRLDDDDVRADLGSLADALETELASMSSFDVYRAEVLSGALEWTPAHRDEGFWKENVEKLDRNQQEVLRCLVRLLHEASDDVVLAVACNDLAQFIKFHPRGRSIAQTLGVKARLMELMVSGSGDVRRYALNCVQVLMIRWNRQS